MIYTPCVKRFRYGHLLNTKYKSLLRFNQCWSHMYCNITLIVKNSNYIQLKKANKNAIINRILIKNQTSKNILIISGL